MKREDMTYRYLVLLVAATIALASCTKDEPSSDPWQEVSDTKISLNVVGGESYGTKLTNTENDGTFTTAFDKGDNLGILGYLVSDNQATGTSKEGSVSYATPYIDDWKLVYDGNTANVYDSPYYWPKFDHCDYESIWFYSYYAYNGHGEGPTLVKPQGAKPYFTYTTDIEGQAAVEDFLVAQTNASKNNVPLNFKHPLSKVEWYVKNLDFIGTKGVDLSFPIIPTGTFNYKSKTNDESGLIEETGNEWTLGAGTSIITMKLDNEVLVPGITQSAYDAIFSGEKPDYSSVEAVKVDECYLIPQTLEGIALVYNYHTEPDQVYTNETLELKDIEVALQAGYVHKVTLIINRHQVIRVGVLTIDANNKATVSEQWYTITNTNTI